jgi:hypothetical protein
MCVRAVVGAGLAGDRGAGRIEGARFHAGVSELAVARKPGSYRAVV